MISMRFSLLCASMSAICFSVRFLRGRSVSMGLSSLTPRGGGAHFVVDEVEPPGDGHDGLGLVLLQQHGPDELVDAGLLLGGVEFLLLSVGVRGSVVDRSGRRTFFTFRFSRCWLSSLSRAATMVWSSGCLLAPNLKSPG